MYMSANGESPTAVEVVRLIEAGFLDVTVRRLQAQHPEVAADVEDAVANAVLKLVSRPADKPAVRDVAGYLYTATRHGVLDAHKRQQRLAAYEPDEHDGDDLPADHDLLQKEAFRALQQLVRGWPNRNVREYMLLYIDSLFYGEPLTSADAAAQLSDNFGEEVRLGSISQWKRRGLAQLLQDYEAERRVDADAERTD